MIETLQTLLHQQDWRVFIEVPLIFLAVYGILYYLRGTRSSLMIAALVLIYTFLYFIAHFNFDIGHLTLNWG